MRDFCARVTTHTKRQVLVVCAFFNISLMAAYVDADQRDLLKEKYGNVSHVFEQYEDNEKTLEIKFVRQGKTVCGARWDTFKLAPEEQDIWCNVSHGVSSRMFFRDTFTEWRIMQVFEEFQKFLLKGHESVRSIHGVPMITAQDMTAVLDPPPVNPWALAFTAQAMLDKKPGRLCITAVDFECCLLRDLKRAHPEQTQDLREQLVTLQKMVCDFSQNVKVYFAELGKRMDRLEQGCASLAQDLTTLESNQKNV